MRKLLLAPSQAGYSATDGAAALEAALSGGMPRSRLDFLGAIARVEAQWSVGPADFQYLRAFFRTGSGQTSEPFLIDLVLDDFELTEYTAKFVPGSLRITKVVGQTTSCSAQLHVQPQPIDEDLDNAILDSYEIYGSGGSDFYAQLAQFANFDIGISAG